MGFKINRVYTRTGDDGQTTLADGKRYDKSSAVIDAIGSMDEVNTEFGNILDYLDSQTEELKVCILDIQQDVFDIGAELACPNDKNVWTTTEQDVKKLEALCDRLGKDLPELNSFILPGGSHLVSAIHRARVTSRKAERIFSTLDANPNSLKYLNRLSDMLFNMARYAIVLQNKEAILWNPKKTRQL